ncbi:hypothetical protein H0H81_012524 [Sphagnurus paluster]|uniref:Transmembrane protein n=1 Tax=Sphagnurus paluster TaxID=117069 RepID=A0A9P7K6T8_9AGAR|nr:hypothetical protein H0H81_012524 [Sphagnurus paluster]
MSFQSYSGRSLHTASAQGATATINFNGRRSNYGKFTISVDGLTITNGDAQSAQDSANQLLGSASGLANGPHIAVLTNTGGAPIDIDWVNIVTQASFSKTQAITTTFDDTNPAIQYLPSPSAWSENRNQAFLNDTLHFTNSTGASASLSFIGDAVAVYGTMAPDHADVRVTLDGQSRLFTGGAGSFVTSLHSQVLLYYANNLGAEPHVLTLTSVAQQGTGPFIDVDAITVYSSDKPSSGNNPSTPGAPSSGGSGAGIPQPSASALSVPKTRSMAPIIGGVVGGVVGMILLLALVLLFLRRRNRAPPTAGNKGDLYPPTSPKTPELPMQGPSMMEAGLSRVVPAQSFPIPTNIAPPPPSMLPTSDDSRHSIASYYSNASAESSPRSSTGLLPAHGPPFRLASPRYGTPRAVEPVMVSGDLKLVANARE